MSRQPTLERIIRRHTLGRSLGLLTLWVLLVGLVAAWLIHDQLSQHHRRNIDEFSYELQQSLASLQQQVRSLARNDLITNSIIDYSNRDSYLPVFFRSLELTVTEDVSIAFVDFSGEVITGKNLPLFLAAQDRFAWQRQVLSEARSFLAYSDQGVLVAAPVLYASQAEGAIVAYVRDLADLVRHPQHREETALVDANGRVLFSTHLQLRVGGVYQRQQLGGWFVLEQALDTYRVVSFQSFYSAYGQIFWLAAIFLVAVIAVVLGTFSSIRMSARIAAGSLARLQQNITQASHSSSHFTPVLASQNEPAEFSALRTSYNALLGQLFDTTISRDKFEGVINSLDELLLVIDYQGKVILYNQSLVHFAKSIGLESPQQVQNTLPEEFLSLTDDVDRSYEQRYTRQDQQVSGGPFCDIRWGRSQYRGAQNQPLGLVLVGNDITLERQLEAELLIKNQAVDDAQTSIVIADAKRPGRPITYVNRAFELLTGYSKREAIGRSCSFLQGPETSEEAVEAIRTALRAERSITITLVNYCKNGQRFFNELTLHPIINEQGEVSHILGLQVDVTEREHASLYLKEAKQKAEDSTRLKSHFLASMSHEIRTPMNGIMGMLSLLLQSKLSREQQHHAELAKSSADHLLWLINDILDFSKIEAGRLELDSVDFDLLQLLGDVAESMAGAAQDKGLEVVLDVSQVQVPWICGDSGRLRQILVNLVSNAIKFTQQGHVLIRLATQPGEHGMVLLQGEVLDTGIGMSDQTQERLFSPFTQADASTTRQYGGTGLGLAICRQLCGLMQGDVEVSSELGQGSRFSFHLQLLSARQSSDYSYPSAGWLQGMWVLVIDDNQTSAQVLGQQLQSWGAQTQLCSSSQAALDHLARQSYDVLLVDRYLGSEDGLQLGPELRHAAPESRLILMTALDRQVDTVQLAAQGFAAHFPKPTILHDLITSFGSLGEQAAVEEEERISVAAELVERHVLLVEDNHINQVLAVTLLQSIGVEVDVAENGQQALEQLEAKPGYYALLLMDCQMPVMDGFEATQRIRAGDGGDGYCKVPIVAMTANAMRGDRERCLQAGMDDYISKPIDIAAVKKKLTEWLAL